MTGFGPGSRIAGYLLEEQVGQGGMAVVFRARDERLGRLVALKILAPALAADEAFRQRFVRESRAAAAVDDPHIVPVFEAGEAQPGAGQHGGVLFIAMRYVPGGDVRTMMRQEGPLAPARAAAVISQVASALDAAHRAGLVHRDVKPGNMLVDAQAGRPDHVYLSDFGLSKGALSTSVGLTGVGQFLGTVDYISPEQIEGKPVDGRADQYALACATFEMLTGAPPFRREEAMAVMYAQLSEPPPLLTAQRPDLPPATDDVFARALAKAPAERYASCRDFADALRAAFGLTPYDSGSGIIPAAGHSPTHVAWPAAAGPSPTHVAWPAAAAAAVPAAAATVVDGAGLAASPAGFPDTLAGATVPGRADTGGGPGDGGDGPPRRRRRVSPLALAGVGAVAVAGAAVAVILANGPGHRTVNDSKQVSTPTPTAARTAKPTPSQTATPTATAAPPVIVPPTTAAPTTAPPTTAPPTTAPPTTTPTPTATAPTPTATASATTGTGTGTGG